MKRSKYVVQEIASVLGQQLVGTGAQRAQQLVGSVPQSPQELGVTPFLEQTPRARLIRQITRIANRWGWWSAVVEPFLDDSQAPSLADLTQEALETLLERLNRYVDAAHTACDFADCPPAR